MAARRLSAFPPFDPGPARSRAWVAEDIAERARRVGELHSQRDWSAVATTHRERNRDVEWHRVAGVGTGGDTGMSDSARLMCRREERQRLQRRFLLTRHGRSRRLVVAFPRYPLCGHRSGGVVVVRATTRAGTAAGTVAATPLAEGPPLLTGGRTSVLNATTTHELPHFQAAASFRR